MKNFIILLYFILIGVIVVFMFYIFKSYILKNIYNNISVGDIFISKMDEGNPFTNVYVKVTNKDEFNGKYWIEYTADGIHRLSRQLTDFLKIYKSKK